MEIIVGIDVSKDRLDVHVAPSGEPFWLGSMPGWDLFRQLTALSASVVALERQAVLRLWRLLR